MRGLDAAVIGISMRAGLPSSEQRPGAAEVAKA